MVPIMTYLKFRTFVWKIFAHYFCFSLLINQILIGRGSQALSCDSLLIGQYLCSPPDVDPNTQQPVGCTTDNQAFVVCQAADGLECESLSENRTFTKTISCHHTNGKDFKTALLLSIFFGWLGIDRFYLGYAAVGLFKLFTFGFFFIFHLVDIVLIALQVVGPADGSSYVIDYYGPKSSYVGFTNITAIQHTASDNLVHEL